MDQRPTQKLMSSATDNPIEKEKVVVVDIEPPPEVNHEALIVSQLERLCRLMIDYYQRIFGFKSIRLHKSGN
ncbi:hypothetical protein L2E82_47696 [Cichorium intybus]|uniref:Uncharacterized protein n=1 Tax=Cichorium intybus TaxID=13427 RepID=A0ACB8YXF5_CICIN|nr:hypothetical protein L2E82_47696 [Cichorium intybus]